MIWFWRNTKYNILLTKDQTHKIFYLIWFVRKCGWKFYLKKFAYFFGSPKIKFDLIWSFHYIFIANFIWSDLTASNSLMNDGNLIWFDLIRAVSTIEKFDLIWFTIILLYKIFDLIIWKISIWTPPHLGPLGPSRLQGLERGRISSINRN